FRKDGNILDFVKELPPTLVDKLLGAFLESSARPIRHHSKTKSNSSFGGDIKHQQRTAYDFVVDLTRPGDIYGKIQAYPVSFPLGKAAYDSKTKQDGRKLSRFMVNVVGRYNVGKTYVLRLLANIDLGHSFVERTSGISVSLPTPKNSHDPNIALIDTAGARTPVDYDQNSFAMLSYERQISDAFIQEIALNSSEIFLLVINQLTLDDQLYLKMLYKRLKDKKINAREIKQRLLIVHNYFNLRTIEEVEQTAQYELGELFGAAKQHEGHWLSKDFKHFILANSDSEAGLFYNDHTVEQLLTMIKASNAAEVTNVLEHIMYEVELLLKKFLEEHHSTDDGDDENVETKVDANTNTITPDLDKQTKLQISRKRQVQLELELQQLSIDELQPEALWFICPKRPLPNNVILSKNLKFNEDGSVYIDYSSQFIPDVHIAQTNDDGDIEILIECPSCSNSSIQLTVRGTTLLVQGEKFNNRMKKDYLNTRRIGKFELQVPVAKLDDERTFDFQRRKFSFQDGII
ncbi:unnamed protein product, partial [Adineta ricciae]